MVFETSVELITGSNFRIGPINLLKALLDRPWADLIERESAQDYLKVKLRKKGSKDCVRISSNHVSFGPAPITKCSVRYMATSRSTFLWCWHTNPTENADLEYLQSLSLSETFSKRTHCVIVDGSLTTLVSNEYQCPGGPIWSTSSPIAGGQKRSPVFSQLRTIDVSWPAPATRTAIARSRNMSSSRSRGEGISSVLLPRNG